jgi:shikimate dehydrogenase
MEQYGLIGKQLTHSFSKKYFTQKFENEKIDARYDNYELSDIKAVINLFEQGIKGFNVTIPFKESIIPYLDELHEEVLEIGAVNTVFLKDGRKIGYNTDAFGFKQMIKPFFKSHHERAMILGTGGAAKAVAYVLENLGAKVIYISRTPSGENEFGYDEINENMVKFNGVIVNTTPIGTFPAIDEVVNFPYHFLTERNLVIDLIYNPEETVFLKNAKHQGAWILNGKTMLKQQAEKAWAIWNGL